MVLLTRSREENDVAVEKLTAVGFQSLCAPMLHHTNLFLSSGGCIASHIIITSKYAAKIVTRHCSVNAKCWVVGLESASILRQNSCIEITFIAQNLQDLLKHIESIRASEGDAFFSSSLYLSGSIITKDLPAYITRQVIYATHYIKELPRNVINAITKGQVQYIMVYSKNCAINLIALLKANNLLSHIRTSVVIAISERVANIFDGIAKDTVYSHSANFEDTLKLLVKYEQGGAHNL
jgi:uroporphyrinogen-III synthase